VFCCQPAKISKIDLCETFESRVYGTFIRVFRELGLGQSRFFREFTPRGDFLFITSQQRASHHSLLFAAFFSALLCHSLRLILLSQIE
jgi:hypothetical protein